MTTFMALNNTLAATRQVAVGAITHHRSRRPGRVCVSMKAMNRAVARSWEGDFCRKKKWYIEVAKLISLGGGHVAVTVCSP